MMENQTTKQTEQTYSPTHCKLWEHPDNYCGECWPDYYSAGVGQSRDSDSLERANFDAMLTALGGESGEEDNGIAAVRIVRETHWAVGWVEWIAIHSSASTELKIADEILKGLEGYPVVDEGLWGEYEWEECSEVWSGCYTWKERLEYLREHSLPAALKCWKAVLAAVRGDWDVAGTMLNNPRDLVVD